MNPLLAIGQILVSIALIVAILLRLNRCRQLVQPVHHEAEDRQDRVADIAFGGSGSAASRPLTSISGQRWRTTARA